MANELLRRRINFIRQGSEVERFHTKRMIQRNDVGHHSFHVAWLAHLMAEGAGMDNDANLILAALGHDLAEHITGDMPGDFKREMGIREQFGQYEVELFKDVQLSNFEASLHPGQKRILKLADMMEGAFFCISEASFGNGRVGIVFKNFRGYIGKFAPFSEVEAAIVEYIDELWLNYGVNDAPGWSKTAHKEESMQDESIIGEEAASPPRSGLVEELRREEAEGRATPLLCGHARVEKLGGSWKCQDCGATREMFQPWAQPPQSQPPVQGDATVAEQPVDEPTDDRATSDAAPERPSSAANARQHGGDHYKGVGYEHWDLVLDSSMNYFQGCATKYVTRWRKHEAGDLNLLKAIHYVDKLEEAWEAGRIKPYGAYTVSDIVSFGIANQLNELELQVIKDIIGWRLDQARSGLERLRAGYSEPERKGGRAYYSEVEAG